MNGLFFNLKPVSQNDSDCLKSHQTMNKKPLLLKLKKTTQPTYKWPDFSLINKTMSPAVYVDDAVSAVTPANTIKCRYKHIQDGG